MASHTERTFNRVAISRRDMEQCLEYLNALEEVTSTPAQRGLVAAAIVAYGRPFSQNTDHPRAKSTVSIKKASLDANQKALHARLLEVRNGAIAHADYELHPTRPVEFRDTGFLMASRHFDPLTEFSSTDEFLALATKLENFFLNEMYRLAKRGAQQGEYPV